MRTVIVALGSFIVGAVCMSLFGNGNHISTFVHPEVAFAQESPAKSTSSPSPVAPAGTNPYVPVVPPLSRVFKENNMEGGVLYELDGMRSTGEIFINSHIRYGGGAFQLVRARFGGNTQVELVGAAANTLAFWNMLGYGLCPLAAPAPPPTNPNTPVIHSASLKTEVTGNFASAYSGK